MNKILWAVHADYLTDDPTGGGPFRTAGPGKWAKSETFYVLADDQSGALMGFMADCDPSITYNLIGEPLVSLASSFDQNGQQRPVPIRRPGSRR
jgi:hypothetical protein